VRRLERAVPRRERCAGVAPVVAVRAKTRRAMEKRCWELSKRGARWYSSANPALAIHAHQPGSMARRFNQRVKCGEE